MVTKFIYTNIIYNKNGQIIMLKYTDFINEAKRTSSLTPDEQLLSAVSKGSSSKVKQLIKSGANINFIEDSTGETPLMIACDSNFLAIVYILVKAGADLNIRDKFGRTALMKSSTLKIIEILLESGADVNIKNNRGDNVFMDKIRESYKYSDCDDFLVFFRILLDHGLDLNTIDNDGENFYDIIKNIEFSIQNYQRIEYNKIVDFFNTNYPEFKEEWEVKNDMVKYNL
jgi:uncharacterized protein